MIRLLNGRPCSTKIVLNTCSELNRGNMYATTECSRNAHNHRNMKSLVEQAKAVSVKSNTKNTYSDEHIDLVLAYLNGEVTNKQMCVAAKIHQTGASTFAGQVLMWGIRYGKIVRANHE